MAYELVSGKVEDAYLGTACGVVEADVYMIGCGIGIDFEFQGIDVVDTGGRAVYFAYESQLGIQFVGHLAAELACADWRGECEQSVGSGVLVGWEFRFVSVGNGVPLVNGVFSNTVVAHYGVFRRQIDDISVDFVDTHCVLRRIFIYIELFGRFGGWESRESEIVVFNPIVFEFGHCSRNGQRRQVVVAKVEISYGREFGRESEFREVVFKEPEQIQTVFYGFGYRHLRYIVLLCADFEFVGNDIGQSQRCKVVGVAVQYLELRRVLRQDNLVQPLLRAEDGNKVECVFCKNYFGYSGNIGFHTLYGIGVAEVAGFQLSTSAMPNCSALVLPVSADACLKKSFNASTSAWL